MPSMRPSMSICTPRACPSSGRNSEYGKLEPTMSSVSHPVIRSQLGLVPRSPIEPVTHGRSSGSAALPSSALATPAPSSSATSITSAAGLQGALADQDRDALAAVEDLGGAAQIGVLRHDARRAEAVADA